MKERKTNEIEVCAGKLNEKKVGYLHGKQSEAKNFLKKVMNGKKPKKVYNEFKG